jgi:hypothetical protein
VRRLFDCRRLRADFPLDPSVLHGPVTRGPGAAPTSRVTASTRGLHSSGIAIMVPTSATEPLTNTSPTCSGCMHARDLAQGFGRVALPVALDRTFPRCAGGWRWQFVFPATRLCRDPHLGRRRGTTCVNP